MNRVVGLLLRYIYALVIAVMPLILIKIYGYIYSVDTSATPWLLIYLIPILFCFYVINTIQIIMEISGRKSSNSKLTIKSQFPDPAIRLLAFMIDIFLIPLVIVIFMTIPIRLFETIKIPMIVNFLAGQFPLILVTGVILIHTYLECSKFQATPGKYIFNLRVVSENGGKISFLRSLTRTLIKFLSFFFFPIFIVIMFSKRRQCLHDMIAKCLVIKKPSNQTQN